MPLYIDLGRYDTARALAMVIPLIMAYFFYGRHQSYRRGFAGEKQVIKALSSTLSDDYFLINDVKLVAGKGSNIDHIVLGPTGIFVLETKNHRGKITIRGDSWKGVGQNPFAQARFNAWSVYEVIRASGIFALKLPWFQAVVVFANKKVELEVHEAPSKVEVLKINELTNYITKETRHPSAQEIELMSKEILNVHECGGLKLVQPAAFDS